MADIQDKILRKYGIDISYENIFKLYKMDSPDITPQELDVKIQDTRKRWTISVNGANEKNAKRDSARLEKADQFESVLKDEKLRREVFDYYSKRSGATAGGTSSENGSTEFAKEYFELVGTTKKIKKEDVDFFFKYYQSQRKNKKAILEMLSNELKVNGLGKEDKYNAENNEAEEEGKRKDESSPLITNLFQEATVIKIQRALEKFNEAAQSSEVCHRYPNIRNGLYDFLDIKDVEDARQFTKLMSDKGKEVYAIRQERGTEYVPLVDMFNILQSIGEYRDVVDNIYEFKLLLKYPNLTPYMFSFVDMKPSTVEGIVNIANRDYAFRDNTDFILNYYKPVYDNFGINVSSIGSIIHKAEKKAKQNKVLNSIDEKIGRKKDKSKISFGAKIIHWLVYWPIFVFFFIFEVTKSIFTSLHRLTIPFFLLVFGLESWLLPNFEFDNLLVLRKLFNKVQWHEYVYDFLGYSGENGAEWFFLSVMVITILAAVYIIPPLVTSFFISGFADQFNKNYDWVGWERTFKEIIKKLRNKTEEQYFEDKKAFAKRKIGKIILNLVCVAIIAAIVIFAPRIFELIKGKIG